MHKKIWLNFENGLKKLYLESWMHLYIYLYIIHLKIRRLIFFANTLTLPVYFELFIKNIRLLSITIFLSKISRIFFRLNFNFFILTIYKNVKSWISSCYFVGYDEKIDLILIHLPLSNKNNSICIRKRLLIRFCQQIHAVVYYPFIMANPRKHS